MKISVKTLNIVFAYQLLSAECVPRVPLIFIVWHTRWNTVKPFPERADVILFHSSTFFGEIYKIYYGVYIQKKRKVYN